MTLFAAATLITLRTNGEVEAFLEGKRIREQRGEAYARGLANALYRDLRNDSLSVQAEVGAIKAKFPETWGYIAGGLDPENRNENGEPR